MSLKYFFCSGKGGDERQDPDGHRGGPGHDHPPETDGGHKRGGALVVVSYFNVTKLLELGFSIREKTDEYCIIVDNDSGNEVIMWNLGGWLQFRCNVLDTKSPVGSNGYISVSETINRLHDVALGARISLSDAGEIVLVSDVLNSTVNDEVIAEMSNQLLFLSDRLISALEDISRGRKSLSNSEIDEMLS